jgi:hypothetical protein
MKTHATMRRISRRQWLKTGAAAACGVLGSHVTTRYATADISDHYAGLKTVDYLGPVQTLATIEDREVFTEGPAVDRDGVVYFTNVPVSKILRFDPRSK